MSASAEMKITSAGFKDGEQIPIQYTGEGQDLSPPLAWTGAPENTKELALIVEDPDAPGRAPWVHWVICKIPPQVHELPEGIKASYSQDGLIQGKNSWGSVGYRGPLPPPGRGAHRYQFHLYALSSPLAASAGLTVNELRPLMKGKILAESMLVGMYER